MNRFRREVVDLIVLRRRNMDVLTMETQFADMVGFDPRTSHEDEFVGVEALIAHAMTTITRAAEITVASAPVNTNIVPTEPVPGEGPDPGSGGGQGWQSWDLAKRYGVRPRFRSHDAPSRWTQGEEAPRERVPCLLERANTVKASSLCSAETEICPGRRSEIISYSLLDQ